MARSLKQAAADIRAAATQVQGFRKQHVLDKDDVDRLFEFSVYFERIDKLATAMAQKAVIRSGKNHWFARKPGNRANFNYVELGPFRFYFGVEFSGPLSTATYAPDVAIAHKNLPDRVLIAVECKHRIGKTINRGDVLAFVAVLIELSRPMMLDSNGSNIIPGFLFICGPLIAPADADLLRNAYGDGRSYLCTTARAAATNQKKVAALYGFEIMHLTFP